MLYGVRTLGEQGATCVLFLIYQSRLLRRDHEVVVVRLLTAATKKLRFEPVKFDYYCEVTYCIFLLQLVNAMEQFAPVLPNDVSMILKETYIIVKKHETERLQVVVILV